METPSSVTIEALTERIAELEAEVERLRNDYPGGDKEAQALAWVSVYGLLKKLGIERRNDGDDFTGRSRALGFINWLAAEKERTKELEAERDRLRAEVAELKERW